MCARGTYFAFINVFDIWFLNCSDSVIFLFFILCILYRVVTSAWSCNKVGHLFWFTILAQHEANDVILYIYNVYKTPKQVFKTWRL